MYQKLIYFCLVPNGISTRRLSGVLIKKIRINEMSQWSDIDGNVSYYNGHCHQEQQIVANKKKQQQNGSLKIQKFVLD